MKKAKKIEKNIRIYIKDSADLKQIDEIVYGQIGPNMKSYESSFDPEMRIREENGELTSEIKIIANLHENVDDFRFILDIYREIVDTIEDIKCMIVVNDSTYISSIE